MQRIKKESGNVWAWLIWLVMAALVAAGGFLLVLNLGLIKPPDIIADYPIVKMVVPPEPELVEIPEEELTTEELIRQQLILLNSRYIAAQSVIDSQEEDIAVLERQIKERDDEIARLRNSMRMTQDQTLDAVATIYEKMSPSESAVILENMGADRAALILDKIDSEKAAAILEQMTEPFAEQVSAILSGELPSDEPEEAPEPDLESIAGPNMGMPAVPDPVDE
ncbi:MAG TPA: hypothetical protein VGB30_11550 [bacterium]|jgi:flagellar motility protein MotE (MotC chaperone)